MPRRILTAVLILREYMEDAPADQIASVNAFDGSGKEEDGTNKTGEQRVQVLKNQTVVSMRATSQQRVAVSSVSIATERVY